MNIRQNQTLTVMAVKTVRFPGKPDLCQNSWDSRHCAGMLAPAALESHSPAALLCLCVRVCLQVRRAAGSNSQNGTTSSRGTPTNGSKSGSPLATTSDDEASSSSSSGSSGSTAKSPLSAPSILPSFQLLPRVGATGVQLLQQLGGQTNQPGDQPQPQQVQGGGDKAAAGREPPAAPAAAGDSTADMGGTPVTAQRAELAGRVSPTGTLRTKK